MDALADTFISQLEHRKPDPQLLARVGDEDPVRGVGDFVDAAQHADLATNTRLWVPPLLRSARPAFGARCLFDLAERCRENGTPLDLARTPSVPAVLGASNFLARRLLSHPDWITDLAGDIPPAPGLDPIEPEWSAIRVAKYRGLLHIAARDILHRSFAESLRELSDLADRCLVAGLTCAEREIGTPAPALFGLGKLGGRELNFSSDVDLLFVYTPAPERDPLQENHDVALLIRHLKSHMEAPTVDGFGYRVDLDLRPEGPTGVLANSVDAALGYYEAFGAEWERQMLIRLRGVAGPVEARETFASNITPFIYRRLIDPGVMDSVRAMKERIESERREAGRDLEGDLKEGPGGIRDVEFLVQSLQLFFGGRHSELRSGNVLDSLDALRELELLPEPVTRSLSDAYLWLRRAEHSVQLPEEQQTAAFPRDPLHQLGLARRMGYADAEGGAARDRMLEDWTAVRNETRAHFDALVLREGE